MKHGPFYIPSLDGMRTVAFFVVFLSHVGVPGVQGGFGVTIFFFLSGYLITTLFRREQAKHNRISLKKFYMRRILRIWPPFYVVLLLGVVVTLSGALTNELDPLAVLAQVFHVNNYHRIFFGADVAELQGITLGSTVYWSLAVEEHFYLMFPLAYIFFMRRKLSGRTQWLILVAACGAVLVWRLYLIFGLGATENRIYYSTDARIDSILFGCALAVFGNPMLDLDRASRRLRRTLQIAVPVALAVLLWTFVGHSIEFRETVRYSIQGLALYPLFMAAILYPNWLIFRGLNWGWMRYLGTLSYSLYLVHFTILHLLWAHLDQLHYLTQGAIALGLSLALSWAIYRFVEQPMAKLKKHFSSDAVPSADPRQPVASIDSKKSRT